MNFSTTAFAVLALALPSTSNEPTGLDKERSPIELTKGARIVLIGNGLGSRMLHFGHFESGLHLRYPNHELFIRNMCDEGNTPSFRAHSGRANQLGFPGAEPFTETYTGGRLAKGAGHFETEEEWLARLRPDVIIAFFGFNESLDGLSGLNNFEGELDGPYVQYWPGGDKRGEGSYQQGLLHGSWSFWNEDGSVDGVRTGNYSEGTLLR